MSEPPFRQQEIYASLISHDFKSAQVASTERRPLKARSYIDVFWDWACRIYVPCPHMISNIGTSYSWLTRQDLWRSRVRRLVWVDFRVA